MRIGTSISRTSTSRARFYYLCAILDGWSRYLVHWEWRESMTTQDVTTIAQRAREKFPDTYPRIISDNGPQFIARDFRECIRVAGMTHVRTAPYYPPSNGKLERWNQTLKVTCAHLTCQGHEAQCKNCARTVCVQDVEKGLCKTCVRLALTADPSDALISASIRANDGEPPRRGNWRTAQDSQHTVVEIDQGWSRKLVLTVAHGEAVPATVMRHSLLGSKRTI